MNFGVPKGVDSRFIHKEALIIASQMMFCKFAIASDLTSFTRMMPFQDALSTTQERTLPALQRYFLNNK